MLVTPGDRRGHRDVVSPNSGAAASSLTPIGVHVPRSIWLEELGHHTASACKCELSLALRLMLVANAGTSCADREVRTRCSFFELVPRLPNPSAAMLSDLVNIGSAGGEINDASMYRNLQFRRTARPKQRQYASSPVNLSPWPGRLPRAGAHPVNATRPSADLNTAAGRQASG